MHRRPARTSLKFASAITVRDFRPIFYQIRFFHFSLIKRKVLASDCHYANQLSERMAAVFGWTEMCTAVSFTSQFPPQRSRTMADPIHIALIDDDASILDSLQLYFERRKLKVSCFNSSNEFTAAV